MTEDERHMNEKSGARPRGVHRVWSVRRELAEQIAWRTIGMLWTAAGLFGLFEANGLTRSLMSALIIPGLVLVAWPPPHWDTKTTTAIGLALSVAGALTVPATLVPPSGSGGTQGLACSPTAGTSEVLPIEFTPFKTDPTASVTTTGPSAWRVSFSSLKWAGLYLPLPNGLCSYQIDFDAKLNRGANPASGAGWGYGVGVCNTISDAGPAGPSLQYSIYNDPKIGLTGFLPRVILPKANTYENDATSNLAGLGLNFDWNHWTVKVENNYATYHLNNDRKIDSFSLTQATPDLPKTCDNSGLLLRVWGGATDFRNARVVFQPL